MAPFGAASLARAALLLAAGAAAASAAAAKRSPACPQGCIIATTIAPRACACVEERCGKPPSDAQPPSPPRKLASKPESNGTAPDGGAPPGPPPQFAARGGAVPSRAMVPGNCGFCDAAYNTYESIDACMAADRAFQPAGQGLKRDAYPDLSGDQRAVVMAQMAKLRAGLAAQQGQGQGQQQQQGGQQQAQQQAANASSSPAAAAAACPWPIAPPRGDNVSRSNCPVGGGVGMWGGAAAHAGVDQRGGITRPKPQHRRRPLCATPLLPRAPSLRSTTPPATPSCCGGRRSSTPPTPPATSCCRRAPPSSCRAARSAARWSRARSRSHETARCARGAGASGAPFRRAVGFRAPTARGRVPHQAGPAGAARRAGVCGPKRNTRPRPNAHPLLHPRAAGPGGPAAHPQLHAHRRQRHAVGGQRAVPAAVRRRRRGARRRRRRRAPDRCGARQSPGRWGAITRAPQAHQSNFAALCPRPLDAGISANPGSTVDIRSSSSLTNLTQAAGGGPSTLALRGGCSKRGGPPCNGA
jgi:hypothetical protein